MLLKIISTGSQAGNCYALIADNGEILLLDFGCEPNKILRGIDYKVSDVCGACLTHSHGDHAKSYRWIFQNGIPIYTNDETAEHFEIISGEKMIGLPERMPKKIGSWTVIPFYLPHTTRDKETGALIPCPNFGYLIKNGDETLLYATDYEYIPYTFKIQRINYMLLECNHMDDSLEKDSAKYEHVIKGHSSVSTVRDIILANKTPDLRNIILCHLSSENADPETMQKEVQSVAGKWVKVSVAHAGMSVEMSKYPF